MPFFNFSSLDGTAREARPLPSAPGHSPLGGGNHYNPLQPRIHKGNTGGGRWTLVGATEEPPERQKPLTENPKEAPNKNLPAKVPDTAKQESRPPDRTRERVPVPRSRGVAGKLGRLVRHPLLSLGLRVLEQLIEIFRENNSEEGLFEVEDDPNPTSVAVGDVDGVMFYGVNSEYQARGGYRRGADLDPRESTYTAVDRRRSDRARAELIEEYPELPRKYIGRRPNDALYHAEATLLLRAADAHGGSLAGKTIEIYVDRPLCPSCRKVLPLLVHKLGNPKVTVTDPTGTRRTFHDKEMKVEGED